MPSFEELNVLYERDYFEPGDRDYSYESQTQETQSCFRKHAQQFLALTQLGARILDVGCATGEFLQELERVSLEGVGIERSIYACENARNKGMSIIHGDVGSSELDEMGFNGIHMSHVLEHLPDLHATMKRISGLLIKPGIVYIEVPYQFDSSLDTTNRLLKRQKKQFSPFSIHHCYFFTPQSISLLLKKHGFEILNLCTYLRCKRAGRRPSLRKHLLSAFLYISDRLFNGGDIISVWARLPG
ncbi:MAG: class I SAM-dependent methyltransferase [Pyrinomonadaceae bacterium]